MHLKSLTLKGFKSFASATTLKFEPGICAVVGPNGSGKSNVVDALTWVMGEQGAKNLRGGKMEDVIFAGAGDRKPLGRAEVTLTIDNSDGKLPIDYTEVSITRRMFRDGASEYEINGAKARLMDIQELLSDSGIGREMHIIVGQNKLGDILTSRPEERRAYIEEAAGVLKHRRRKEKAQRKLQSMQVNLDRLQDLNDELKKQLGPLGRQAEAAKRAATVQADLRDARLKLAGDTLVTVRTQRDQAAQAAEVAAAQAEAASERAEELAEAQREIEAELAELEPQVQAAGDIFFRVSTLSERLSATLRVARERASSAGQVTAYMGQDPDELLARAEQADEYLAELTEAAEEAAEQLENVREELAERQQAFDEAEAEHRAQVRALADRREGVVRLIAAEESLASRVTAAEEEIVRQEEVLAETRERTRAARKEASEASEAAANLRSERAPLDDAHVRAAAEAAAAEKRLEQVQDQQRERERVVYSLRSRIDTLRENAPSQPAGEVLGDGFASLADKITPQDASVAPALAAALGNFSQAVVGPLEDELVARLADASRVAVVDARAQQSQPWRMESKLPDGARWLLDVVTVAPEVQAPLNRLLSDVVFAEDFGAANTVVNDDPRLRAVTRDGVLVGEGWIVAGTAGTSAVESTAAIAQAEEDLEHAAAELEELAGTVAGARQAAEEARVAAARATSALREHDATLHAAEKEAERLGSLVKTNKNEHERAAERATQAQARLGQLRQELDEARDRLARAGDTDDIEEASTEQRDEAAQAVTAIRSMEMEAHMALRSAQDKVGAQAGKGDSLRRQAEHERQAKARHDRAMAARRHAGEVARVVAEAAAEVAERTAVAVERAVEKRDAIQGERAQAQARAQQVKSEASAAQHQLSRLTQQAHQAEIALSEAQVRADEAEAKLTEQLGLPVEELLRDYQPDEDFDRAAETARLKRAERDLRSLGKVNPLALEEYTALQERYEYLATQLHDVIQAREDLQGVIRDVDDRILQLFTQAWKDVEAEFPAVFDILFPGGEGRLVLTDPDDILTTGIEVEARPPGKKVKRLSLLSGGEKSLTALALLVAIFRARPSPFYVMDEVEAALDDVNLRRLIALFKQLRKDSQLIVITHQKPTMDVANVLYGVTMQGDGVTKVLSQRMSPAED
ncbi:chromosome segregation protein SMC [Corynebacterium tapiri]|uniref:Chromosome partition protein Smc n=1 Tax=Corynebacterium tapiri TaxID=1448266 RepID=A0A5C4U6B9_9CORY|nr:chromosome segregation protein SMC [Corynebacterium tapiri]TNL99324.1 chromosome segregation protein SMC [Corynebacterium tapiri]